MDHLDTPEQAAFIRRMIETGAVLILEGEDGVTYRCHQDEVELPQEAAGLPRYELTQAGKEEGTL